MEGHLQEHHAATKNQNAVSAYFKRKHIDLLPFHFAVQYIGVWQILIATIK